MTLKKLYTLSAEARQQAVADHVGLDESALSTLNQGLSIEQADLMVENVIGQYALPFAVATNFLIHGEAVIVPMVVEEPSIVAGVSYAAKLTRMTGGFNTRSSEPLMIGQIQLMDLSDLEEAISQLQAIEPEMLAVANEHHQTIQTLGGGAKGFEYRPFADTPVGPMLIVHLLYDCRDAMGANAVNTAVESLAPLIEQTIGGRVNLRILSNLTDRRTARADCLILTEPLAREGMSADEVAQAIVEAWAFAAVDPYRAATHNKGIMNGIDAVAVATGNDWRAIEAGAHAYAARSGRYRSMSEWSLVETDDHQPALKGVLELPLSVGTVGGATKSHPTARTAMTILGQPNARQLAEIMVAVGLAQNFAAIRALATEGIQQGHMRLHARKWQSK